MLELLKGHEYRAEFQRLVHIRNIAKELFRNASPVKYYMYNGNCCRQMAYICKKFLEEMIPEYNWTVYESTFICHKTKQEYEHAWCYGKHKSKTGIVVDVAFDNNIKDNYILESEVSKLPTDDKELENKRIVREDAYFDANEFYTGLTGKELIEVLRIIAEKASPAKSA